MIGISVSACIRDMLSGKVDPVTVEKIVGSTMAGTPNEVTELIDEYRRTYWRDFPDQAEALFRQMLADGKIEQPRLTDNYRHPVWQNGTCWVESEDEIVFSR